MNYEKNHRALWNELARTGGGFKYEALIELDLPEALEDCFACQYAEDRGTRFCAERCAVVWGGGGCTEGGSPYSRWRNAKTPRTRKKYAKIIANLKWINRR